MSVLRRLRGGLFEAGFGPGGIRALALIGALAVVRAVALVLIAESLADSIASIADGSDGWRGALLFGAIGAIARAGATWAIGTVAARQAIAAKSGLRGRLAARAIRGGVDTGSTVVLATTGLDDLDDYFGSVIPATVSAVVVPLVLGARILSVDWLSAVVIAATVPLVPLFMILIGMHTREKTDAASGQLARLANHLVELANGLPVLVGLGRVDEQADALDGIQRELRRRTSGTLRVAFLSALALELIATLSVALVAVTLGLRLLGGGIGLGTALLVLLLAPDCFAVLREVGSAFHASQDGRAALRRVRELVATTQGLPRWLPGSDVVVDRVSVSYEGRGAPALPPVSATFPRGRMSVVTGASGAGKSSLLAAIAGDLPAGAAVSGRVRGVDLDRLAVALQSPSFFADSAVAELTLVAGHGARVDSILIALDLADVADRRPSELSPGEARRLAIARAVLRVEAGATTLLLDEPTAHLDEVNAARVLEVIHALPAGVAVIVVSHDPRLVDRADRLIELPSPPIGAGTGAGQEGVGGSGSPAAVPSASTPLADPAADISRRPVVGAAVTLGALLRASRGSWALAVLLGVAATGLGLALTAVSAWLIVRAGEHPAIMYLLVAIVGVRFFGLGRSVARYAERLVTHRAVFAASDALRLRVWAGIAARGAGSRRLREGGGAIDYLVTSLDTLRDLLPRVVVSGAVGALSVAGVMVTVALVDPAAGLLTAVVLGGGFAMAAGLSRRADRAASSRQIAARSALVERTASLIASASDLRLNGMATGALEQVSDADERLALLDRRAAWSRGLGVAVLSLTTAGLAVVLPFVSESGILLGRPTAETVAVIALLALASLDPLSELLGSVQRLPALRAVLAHLRPFLAEPPRAPEGASIAGPVERVLLDGISARWPGESPPVFEGLDGDIRIGSWLVVDGPSGSGKTTLLTLLLGELAPSAGRILVGSQPLDTVSVAAWRRRVAWCPQDAHVFDSTIRGNLLLSRPRLEPISDDEMIDVLRRVGLAPLLARLHDGLSTRVGARGASLSGGERQRLAVARALLGRSELLLLDEPTAHLDEPTAAIMMADLRAATQDRCVVLVSHRATDRRAVDHRIELRGARDSLLVG